MSNNEPQVKVVNTLDTQQEFGDKNQWRMKQCYEICQADEKHSSLARELSWRHNTLIFSRCKSNKLNELYANEGALNRETPQGGEL
ncbi:DUF1016 N-terminal domain-containing protein [Pelodictyon phaeoclathratiforme]|jgi:hypothetical protein|uniref:YhcG N-terminal domain-containing protein n=1 Tax=Pelodictyon phaeoclathratiforme (strain DSM 5477 / BU-1) TaxID=324925 RepID=B4SEE6_PELPB|nr:DUF1016 N-terminal domain-containing protein [Pelodictyon phaeoclathratiforme]ACF43038.1 hypothetical protein Ppha_0744 [Pelodictyon phaeoclathratiforme BU-1]MBV5289220.1 DUF1016 family protein [Pelodictyon phaeoclathratiforme]